MPKKISNKKPSSTITIETKHESSIYNTPPPSSKNKKKEEKEELINAGTLGRPIGRPSPFQQKYIQKALAKAKFSAQLDTPEADKQFENANDWCTKLQPHQKLVKLVTIIKKCLLRLRISSFSTVCDVVSC